MTITAGKFCHFPPGPLCRVKPGVSLLRNLYLYTPSRMHTMEQSKQGKEKVREYMERRQAERRQNARSPLHDPEQIRREIGWDLVERRRQDRRGK